MQYKQGPVLEENHYYPFGLTQTGISDKALKTQYAENKYRYNAGSELQNKEFSDGTGLELYETNFRSYDQQVGRFFQEDPMADYFNSHSTYEYTENNPTCFNDPTGLQRARPIPINMSGGYLTATSPDFSGVSETQGIVGGMDAYNAQFSPLASASSSLVSQSANGLTTYTVNPDGTWSLASYNPDPTVSSFQGSNGFWVNYVTLGNDASGGTMSTATDHGMFVGAGTGSMGDGGGYALGEAEESNGLEITSKIYESAVISYETTEQSVKGAVALSNRIAGTALKGVEIGSKGLSVGLSIGSAALTIADGLSNGWENHHTADLIVTTVETGLGLFEVSNPIGWGLAAGMFVGNLISEHYTGKSITENLFDN